MRAGGMGCKLFFMFACKLACKFFQENPPWGEEEVLRRMTGKLWQILVF
jgi:hypothetical protein